MLPSCPPPAASGRPRFEVADIFRAHGAAYRQSHALLPQQRAAMWAIEHCRTEVLGGHLDVCTACGDSQPAYNSCRKRHCPKCQGLAQAAWLARRMDRVLPTHYFHVVFTLPHELNPLCRWNPRAMYDLLFDAAAQTLLDFGRGELGAQLGWTAVLHTWTRDLRLHPHLHCVVTGGGLDAKNHRWVPTSSRFLFPVRALAKRFRGKLLDGLRTLHQSGALLFGGTGRALASQMSFRCFLDRLYRKAWGGYSKAPFGGPEQVFAYLCRYTHRVALSNARLLHVDAEQICFRTRHGKQTSLTPEVFIGRFLSHVLPKGFVKIRHYGLMASGHATTRLEEARTVLLETAIPAAVPAIPRQQTAPDAPAGTLAPAAPPELPSWQQQLTALSGVDATICSRCGGVRIRKPLPKRADPMEAFAPVRTDTS